MGMFSRNGSRDPRVMIHPPRHYIIRAKHTYYLALHAHSSRMRVFSASIPSNSYSEYWMWERPSTRTMSWPFEHPDVPILADNEDFTDLVKKLSL
jgi:hypothetical protein